MYNPFSALLRRHMMHVIVHVTDRCGLRCTTCFVPKGVTDMTLDQARVVAKALGPFRWLDIGGGEPFVHPDLVEICKLFQCKSITIPTAGQTPQRIESRVRQLLEEIPVDWTIAVSLDGPEEMNDAIRGPGSYVKARDTFKRLRALPGLTLKVNTVITDQNIDSILPFMDEIWQWGPDYHSLLLLRGVPDSPDMKLPPMPVLRKFTPQILKKMGRYTYGHGNHLGIGRLKRNYQRFLWNVSLNTIANDKCYVPCQAPRLHRVIYPNGQTAMCELMPVEGNAFDESFDTLVARMRQRFDDYEKKNGKCHCTHNCNMGENILAHPPSVLRVLTGITDG